MIDLKTWMDEHRVTVDRAAEIFGKSAGTIRNWRSAGVPENLREWVASRIHEETERLGNQLPDQITLRPDADQFDQWNRAALDDGKIVRDWIYETLDRAAAEDLYNTGTGNVRNFRVAEETHGDAYDAKAGDMSPPDNDEETA